MRKWEGDAKKIKPILHDHDHIGRDDQILQGAML